VRVDEYDLIEIASRARKLAEMLVELCSPEIMRDQSVELRDTDHLCDFVREVHNRCGTMQGECPRYSDPAMEAPCE
jgi:hypothetical protein